jgi:hypothetical protein
VPISFQVVAEIEQPFFVPISGLGLAALVPIGNGWQVDTRISAEDVPGLIVRLDLQNLIFSVYLVPLVVNLDDTLKPDSLKIFDAETDQFLVNIASSSDGSGPCSESCSPGHQTRASRASATTSPKSIADPALSRWREV